ncbi:MAG: hypothetical protein GF353_05715 [Candidatus Lokiarchaeota archaeon]|nr:hypothetical protein [Candidatus Lokiarchaeota archaeon]
MSKQNKNKNPTRSLPIILQGIETVLLYLNSKKKELSSIRNISENTGLSMRVVKNVLLQLEKFNQVERVVEKNNILPKWKISKFGKKVLKEAKGIENNIEFFNREDELLYKIQIPKKIDDLKTKGSAKLQKITKKLKDLQVDFSKLLGLIIDLNNPQFEDIMSFLIKRIKFLKQKVNNLPADPIASLMLKKKGEKQRKLSKNDIFDLYLESYFFNSVILNEIKRIFEFNDKLSNLLENNSISNAFSLANDLREEVRILSSLVYKREDIDVDFHHLTSEMLKNLSKNSITSEMLSELIEVPMSTEEKNKGVESIVLQLLAMLKKGQIHFNDHYIEIKENIPLFALYQLILDEKPSLSITIEDLERVINSLADQGYIPGIKTIQEDENHYLKVVQLIARDISQDEVKLISLANQKQKLSLADIMEETKWKKSKCMKLLIDLTEVGILKYSKSFLHGEYWYLVSRQDE